MLLLSRALNHVLQGQVSDLEFPRLLVVSRLDLLLIGCDADLGLLSHFLRMIQHQREKGVILIWTTPSTRSVDMMMSTGMIASILYANENGVSLVGTRLVVL